MVSRRLSRENALQALYQCDTLNDFSEKCVDWYFKAFHTEEDGCFNAAEHEFTKSLAMGSVQNLEKIDSVIALCSQNWSLSRMSRVDRNILRIAAFEICFMTDIPANVSINEAIEVSKKYASDDSPMFINGVLDKIASEIKANGGIANIQYAKVSNG